MTGISTRLHSVFHAMVGCVLVGAVFLVGLAADFFGFMMEIEVPLVAAALAIVCAGLRSRGLAFARAAWRRAHRSGAVIFVVSKSIRRAHNTALFGFSC